MDSTRERDGCDGEAELELDEGKWSGCTGSLEAGGTGVMWSGAKFDRRGKLPGCSGLERGKKTRGIEWAGKPG